MNKFSFLLAALCVSLIAQETKPAQTAAAAAPSPELKLTGAGKSDQKAYLAEIWFGKSIADCLTFQKNTQVLNQQVEELKRLQVFLDNALTTPEKEARGHEIAAKQAKLKGDNESMGKMYNGFSIERPFQFVSTKAIIATQVSNEEFAKLSGAKDFKPESIIVIGEKRYHIRDSIAGQVEVETFALSLRRISEAKNQLQQLVELQPKLTKDEELKKVEKAIKEIQDGLTVALDEFKKSRGFDYAADAITLPSEGKLVVQITAEEKKAIEAKAPAGAEKK